MLEQTSYALRFLGTSPTHFFKACNDSDAFNEVAEKLHIQRRFGLGEFIAAGGSCLEAYTFDVGGNGRWKTIFPE